MPKLSPVTSSSVAAVGYDEHRHELHVRFVSGDTYIYALVRRSTYLALTNAPSIGTFVNTTIKPHHPCRRA